MYPVSVRPAESCAVTVTLIGAPAVALLGAETANLAKGPVAVAVAELVEPSQVATCGVTAHVYGVPAVRPLSVQVVAERLPVQVPATEPPPAVRATV